MCLLYNGLSLIVVQLCVIQLSTVSGFGSVTNRFSLSQIVFFLLCCVLSLSFYFLVNISWKCACLRASCFCPSLLFCCHHYNPLFVLKGSAGILGLKGYVAERKGEREEMQDAHVILNDITEECNPLPSQITRISYFAVFDGHGGVRASKYAAQNLHQNLIRKFPKGEIPSVEKTIRRCLLDTFKHTDEEFLRQASSQKPAWKDGSTATCVLVIDNTLYIANLGDSRAILCRYNEESQKYTALSLSKEHNPTQYDERMRIQKAGGNVREGRVLGVLEVSRSIGDGQYKRFGVISVPDIKRCQLTHNDRFILLACDGLFKVFSPEEAVNFIMSSLEDNTIPTREAKSALDARSEAACNRLANKAVQRGSADNVTVVVVRIEQ
ncbi:integrin-linked kinase-associated serine/threonine phosphatase 2C isoform X3 [Eublepharis macularius]|uniref:Integrin-linked kinase-associated serine/threonine phosphatase 2C n=1 Tax=Eublepharis macularius TaxID=481883 RepID=A0AA97L2G0_EUBMA|nr:integrin-linked kinase-associated serine/threonine phosphatase 2C isoform X3 [Eublepharis macularius]